MNIQKNAIISITCLAASLLIMSCGGVRKDSEAKDPVALQESNALPSTDQAPTASVNEAPAPTEVTQPVAVTPPVVTPPTETPNPDVPVTPVTPVTPKISFTDVNEKIFKPLCLRCHTAPRGKAGINLNSYALVKTNLDAVKNAVLVEKFMPPAGELEAESASLLQAWIEAGTPE